MKPVKVGQTLRESLKAVTTATFDGPPQMTYDNSIIDVIADPDNRHVSIIGKAVGTTTLEVKTTIGGKPLVGKEVIDVSGPIEEIVMVDMQIPIAEAVPPPLTPAQ